MPQRETRQSIERALAGQKRASLKRALAAQERKSGVLGLDEHREMAARFEQKMAKLREMLDPAEFARLHATFERTVRKISVQIRRKRRPRDGGMPAFVEPPRGPKPLAGGAAAALEFDD